MSVFFRLSAGFLAPTLLAFAQPASEPVMHGEPIVVLGRSPSARPAGATQLRLDEAVRSAGASLENLADRVAGLHVNAGGAGSFGDIIALRGIANTPFFSDPAVTLYYDDLPLGSSFTYPTQLFGFASAVISRGPQGTAFGRGGSAGVIALVSAEPSGQAGGEAGVTLGNFGLRSAALNAHSARRDNLDVSVAASHLTRDGYIENTQLGRGVDDQEASAVSARLRVRPTAASEFTLQLLGSRRRDGAQPLVPLGGPTDTVSRGREGTTDVDFGGVALKAAFATPIGRLSVTTSLTTWSLDPYENRLVLPPTLDSQLAQRQRTWNEEIRLTSGEGSSVAWHAGAWFSDGTTRGEVNRSIPGLFPIEASEFRLESRTLAVFGEAEFAPTAGWRVVAGLRAEEVKRNFDRSQTIPGPGRFTDDKSFTALTPKLTVSHELSKTTQVSASVATGTKPGGWSAYTGDATLAPFKAERTLAFEAGLDTALADNRMKLAVRVFATAIRDYQIERSFTFSDYIVVNAPKARSVGAEFEATWRINAGWTLAASLGVADVTLREFTDPFTGTRYDGNRVPYAPEYDANISVAWRPARGWFVRVELAATGRTNYDESEDPLFSSRAHAVVNVQAGYEQARWRLSSYSQNLTDEEYYALIVPGVGHAAPGAPRTFGVEAVLKF